MYASCIGSFDDMTVVDKVDNALKPRRSWGTSPGGTKHSSFQPIIILELSCGEHFNGGGAPKSQGRSQGTQLEILPIKRAADIAVEPEKFHKLITT